jgi:heme oxygenase
MRLPRPSARSSSVAEDLIVTIRFGGAVIGTDTPQLSMDAAVLAEALGVAFCAAGAPGPPMVDEHADRLMAAAAMMTTMLLGKRRMTTL